MNEFNYKDSLTNIKASLFDIYEDQEKIIGDLDDSIRNQHVNQFIEVKDLALTLLEKIQGLYQDSINYEDNLEEQSLLDVNNSSSVDQTNNIADDSFEDSGVSEEEQDLDSENSKEEEVNSDSEENEDNSSIISSFDTEEANESELSEIEFSKDEEIENDNKYYLLCDEKNLNFAYVPEKLLEKLKKYQREDEEDDISFEENSLDEDSSLEIDDNKVYKKDELPAKGIIVRNDQYMKLALSKHRQEGVLEEAKKYRIDMTKKKRQEEQKIELEKAKVHLDI